MSDFKPTRRVRDPPGGRQHNIFDDVVEADALSSAPPKEGEVVCRFVVSPNGSLIDCARMTSR